MSQRCRRERENIFPVRYPWKVLAKSKIRHESCPVSQDRGSFLLAGTLGSNLGFVDLLDDTHSHRLAHVADSEASERGVLGESLEGGADLCITNELRS